MTNPLRQALASLVGSPTEALVRQLQRTSGEYASPFYSPLELATERSTTARAPGAQWLATLGKAPGVKQEEIDATGLGAFLGGRNGPVARDELLAHLRANRVDVADLMRGGPPRPRGANAAEDVFDEDLPSLEDVEQRIEEDFQDEIFERQNELVDEDFDNWYDGPDDANWRVIPYEPGTDPIRVLEADDTVDMFDPNYRREARGLYEDGTDAGPARYWLANNIGGGRVMRGGVWEDAPDEFDPIDDDYIGSNYTSDNLGPFNTAQEAEDYMDVLRERHRDRAWESFREGDHHNHYATARDEVLDRERGQGDYRYRDDDDYDADESPLSTRWRQFSLKGGQNYGEMTFSFPKREGQGPNTHWPEPNVFGHVRFQDRNVDGKKTLFIEEVQSDWHQRGREGGYKRPASKAELDAAIDANDAAHAERGRLYGELVSVMRAIEPERLAAALRFGAADALRRDGPQAVSTSDLVEAAPALLHGQIINNRLGLNHPQRQALADAYERFRVADRAANDAHFAMVRANEGSGVVPDAPFKDNKWASLVMKRMIRYASENGYDQVAWHPGNLKNGDWRPDSSKPAGWEFYDRVLPNIVNDITKKSGVKVGRQRVAELPTGSGRGVDPDIPIGDGDEIPLSSLAYAIAQESSDLGRWRLPPEVERIRHLYAGSPAVEVAQELRKAMGLLDEAPANAHVLPLTDELKNKALYEGFPLFALPGALATALLAEKLQERMRNRRRESRA